MAAGNIADGIGHRHDDQTEGQRGEKIPRACGITSHHGGGAAGEENQHEGADKLRKILLVILHEPFLLILCTAESRRIRKENQKSARISTIFPMTRTGMRRISSAL